MTRVIFVVTIIIVLLGSACSIKKHQIGITNYITFPGLPDTAHIQFLTSISSSEDVVIKKQSAFVKFVTGEVEQVNYISKPLGIQISNGKIYVTDIGIRGIDIIDLKNGTFEYFKSSGRSLLKMPVNCGIDAGENIFIADAARREILVFNKDRSFVTSFGRNDNFKPIDIFLYNNEIWVLNAITKQVNVYEKNGFNLLNTFPNVEAGDDGYLYTPKNIYVENDTVYVTDFGGFKISKYSLEGEYIASVGSHGSGFGKFARPKGIAVDKDNNLYAIDANFENVQIFNDKGQLLLFFGGHYKGKGDMNLPYGITIDYNNLEYFNKYVHPNYNLKYIILVTNQVGGDKINVYGKVEIKEK